MKERVWVIVGATSIIAEQFAHLVAAKGYSLILTGRDEQQLNIIEKDIQLRYKIPCITVSMDMALPPDKLLSLIQQNDKEIDLFVAHSDFTDNNHLNPQSIKQLIDVNILSTTLLINSYLNLNQKKHHLIYLSSVAACRGRAKNSLYGASKAAVEIYLEGLQQACSQNQNIVIARLGFIDTKQTYGLPGIFYAAPPSTCAKACLNALNRKKRIFYYPAFWRIIMAIISKLPFCIYKKLKL